MNARSAAPSSRIVIADDHPLYREMLAELFSGAADIEALKPVTSYAEALELIRASNPALALLDLDMPGMDGPTGITRIRELYPNTKVAIISGGGTARQIQEALTRGACGYLPKTFRGEMILAAVQLMLSGAVYVPPDMIVQRSHVVPGNAGDAVISASELTPRELEVLRLFTNGMVNKEIARVLGIAEVTVKLHVRNILRKLRVRNRTEAAAVAVSRALVLTESDA